MTDRFATSIIAVLGLSLLSVRATAAAPPAPETPASSTASRAADAPPAATLAALKSLVGTWRNADDPASRLRIHFYLTAGGTVLVEDWRRGTQPHSLTLYHRDGPTLLATHYCPQGNQPRLALAGRDANGLHFAFRDATDLDPATESHQHDLWFDFTNPVRPVRGEIYFGKDGPAAQERLQLVRDSGG